MHLLEDTRIDKRVSIRIDYIRDFKWSPSKNMICYWFRNTMKSTNPPKVGFIQIPTREVWSEREIINGEDVRTEWSADGTKLIAVCKLKRKKEFFNTVAVFDVTMKGIPVDMIKVNTNILDVEWVSLTNRLAILANREKKIKPEWSKYSQLSSVIIYEVKQSNGALVAKMLGKTKEHVCNVVKWAKNGVIFVACDIKHSNPSYQGKFYVYNVRNSVTREEVKSKGK